MGREWNDGCLCKRTASYKGNFEKEHIHGKPTE